MASMVYVKNPNGRTYVYENVTLWNKETKKYIHRRKCIGHLGEDGKEILPNRKKGIPAKPEQPVSSEPDCACSVLTVGTSALLEHVAQETGLSSILRRVFPADWRAMLTCAYFLASEGKALCHAENGPSETVSLSMRHCPARESANSCRASGQGCSRTSSASGRQLSGATSTTPWTSQAYRPTARQSPLCAMATTAMGRNCHRSTSSC